MTTYQSPFLIPAKTTTTPCETAHRRSQLNQPRIYLPTPPTPRYTPGLAAVPCGPPTVTAYHTRRISSMDSAFHHSSTVTTPIEHSCCGHTSTTSIITCHYMTVSINLSRQTYHGQHTSILSNPASGTCTMTYHQPSTTFSLANPPIAAQPHQPPYYAPHRPQTRQQRAITANCKNLEGYPYPSITPLPPSGPPRLSHTNGSTSTRTPPAQRTAPAPNALKDPAEPHPSDIHPDTNLTSSTLDTSTGTKPRRLGGYTGNQTCHPGAPFCAPGVTFLCPGVTVLRPSGIFLCPGVNFLCSSSATLKVNLNLILTYF